MSRASNSGSDTATGARSRLTKQRTYCYSVLSRQPGDEEPGGAVHVWLREQELGAPRMSELRPLLPERLDRKPGGVDDRLVLLGVQRADGIDDRPARLGALRRHPQEL